MSSKLKTRGKSDGVVYSKVAKENITNFLILGKGIKYMGKEQEKGGEVRWEKGITHINVVLNKLFIHFQ